MKLYRVQVIRQSRRFVSARFSTPFRSLNCHSFVTVLGTTSLFVKLRYARHPLPGERRPREKSAANEFNFGDRLCGDRLLHHDTLLVSSDFVTFYAPLLDILLVDNLERGRSNDRRIHRSSCIVSLLLLSDKNEPGRFPRVARGQHLSSIVSAMEF